MFILQDLIRYISVMTQEEFTYIANDIRTKAVETAERFGYAPDDAEDIVQDVMLRLWCLHERFNDTAHLKAAAVIIAKRVCIDKWPSIKTFINGEKTYFKGMKPKD